MFNGGILLGLAGLLIGAAGDWVREQQMKKEVRDAVSEEFERREGGQKE